MRNNLMMSQLQPYIEILKRNWWIAIITMLSAFSLALAASYFTTPIYETKAQFIVSPGPALLATMDQDISDALRGVESLDRRSIIATYEEIMNSQQIIDQVGASMQLEPAELRAYQVTAVVLPDASALQLTVEGPDPVLAAQIANTIGQESIQYIQTLYNQLYTITMLDTAVVPSRPVSPQPERDALIAVVLGFAVGIVLAIAAEYVRTPLGYIGQRVRRNRPAVAIETQVQDASSVQSTQI
jgi:capsular polysaccharide biosynthesis protein